MKMRSGMKPWFGKEKKRKAVAAAALLFAAAYALAHVKIGEGTAVVFATVEEGREILVRPDDFVALMSPFDRAARMKMDKDVSEKEYLEFVGENVLAWEDAEKQKVVSAIQSLRPALEALSYAFPETVFFIKTTGREEGGAVYTRANAIVFPEDYLTTPPEKIKKTIAHELFHILSRANPDLREKLYAAIGFEKCGEVKFPAELKPRKLTNPDAPRNDHCIRLQVEGKERWAIPVLFSDAEKYDKNRGGEFFNYLQFRFLVVERGAQAGAVKPAFQDQNPLLADVQQVSGFIEQVGRNTEYIIHPEEILADNFALLVLGEGNLPSPEIVKKLESFLKDTEPGQLSGIQNVSCQQARDLIRGHQGDSNFVILDFRTKEMFDQAHIEGAIVHDAFSPDIDTWLESLDKNKVYLIYCTLGHRSGIALDKMKGMKFKNILHMHEGLAQWKKLGYETVPGAGPILRGSSPGSQKMVSGESSTTTGKYLGQEPPGSKPVRFPPEAFSANEEWFYHGPLSFSADGLEMFWAKYTVSNPGTVITSSRFNQGRWTPPQTAPFARGNRENGKYFFYNAKNSGDKGFNPYWADARIFKEIKLK